MRQWLLVEWDGHVWLVRAASLWTMQRAKLTVGSVTVTEGQILTIDGSKGEVMVGEVPTVLWRHMSNDF